MKDGVGKIVGKTIINVVVASNSRSPNDQVYLIFSDGTYLEFYGNSFGCTSYVDQGGLAEAIRYSGVMRATITDVFPNDSKLRMLVARNLDCPDEVTISLAENDELFAKLVKDVDLDVAVELASNQTCPPIVLTSLYYRLHDDIIKILVSNPSCPSDVLADIWLDWPDQYASAARANPNFSQELLDELLFEKVQDYEDLLILLERSDCPPDFLRSWASDDSWVIRKYVAQNPATPPDVLRLLSRIVDMTSEKIEVIDDETDDNYNEDVDGNDSEDEEPDFGPSHVRYYANINPSNPSNVARDTTSADTLSVMAADPDVPVRQAVASNEHTPATQLLLLAEDYSDDVRAAVAANLSCPENLFAALCNDKSAAVRLAAANNSNCSKAGLKVLAASKFCEYRELAAKHKNCPRYLFEALSHDPIASVRKAIIENNDCPIDIRAPIYVTEHRKRN